MNGVGEGFIVCVAVLLNIELFDETRSVFVKSLPVENHYREAV